MKKLLVTLLLAMVGLVLAQGWEYGIFEASGIAWSWVSPNQVFVGDEGRTAPTVGIIREGPFFEAFTGLPASEMVGPPDLAVLNFLGARVRGVANYESHTRAC